MKKVMQFVLIVLAVLGVLFIILMLLPDDEKEESTTVTVEEDGSLSEEPAETEDAHTAVQTADAERPAVRMRTVRIAGSFASSFSAECVCSALRLNAASLRVQMTGRRSAGGTASNARRSSSSAIRNSSGSV